MTASTQRLAGRFWPTFMQARLAVAIVLLALQGLVLTLGTTRSMVSLVLCLVHLVAVLAANRMLPPPSRQGVGTLPWMATVGLDLLLFAALQSMRMGGLNYTLLFALPVLMSAILGPKLRGLATAALVTLFLLGDVVWAIWLNLETATSQLFQAAITGTGFFLVALLAHELAQRLAKEEERSELNQLAARTQVAVNELIIETMTDGVLVVDELGTVRTANPASRHMLADARGQVPAQFRLASHAHCLPLLAQVQATFEQHAAQQTEVLLEASPELRRRLRIRTRPVDSQQPAHGKSDLRLCVVFLEDLHELEARVRTEKLVAMGRMSVAVAHEIRNPLSAIAQANALLEEDLHDPLQLQLVQMVATHTRRLNRIVDDVLNVVRVPGQLAPPDTPATALDPAIAQILHEWSGQHACTNRVAWIGGCDGAWIKFDPEHLRRVLVNLLDNASRYTSQAPGAIQVSSRPQADGHWRVSVWSDGEPLDHSVRQHLFEPFFSSESRSSGMGLYLCRELCERYRAQLDYQRSERGGRAGNDFFLLIPAAVADLHP